MTDVVNVVEVFLIFLRLGLTSFGGPIAHLSYFHDEFVRRRQWLSQQEYADCISLAQFLPGPSSSQIGFAIGRHRSGLRGGIAAWCGFTLPSALLMVAAASLLIVAPGDQVAPWLHGIKVMTVAVVLHALWSMGRTFWNTPVALGIGCVTAACLWWQQGSDTQILMLVGGGVVGAMLLPNKPDPSGTAPDAAGPVGRSPSIAVVFCLCAFALLLVLSVCNVAEASHGVARLVLRFYRIGATVFGGGHVVLPLLRTEFVASGDLSVSQFDALYGMAQALPGPLFAVASGIGVMLAPHERALYAAAALVGMFLPGGLLMASLQPVWQNLRRHALLSRWATGVNAASVSLLVAVFYHSDLLTTTSSWREVVAVAVILAVLVKKMVPNWLLLPLSAVAGHYLF
ncbi:MAG: chromate efflux transporter [Deltaproteobacteria bacterium]|nr:chromate efflux transporter [Deltaproteobacteria bacterium]